LIIYLHVYFIYHILVVIFKYNYFYLYSFSGLIKTQGKVMGTFRVVKWLWGFSDPKTEYKG